MQDEQKGEDQPQEAGWVFKPGEAATSTDSATGGSSAPAPTASSVSWSASEYIAHPKNAGWFMLLGIAAIVVAAIVYLITKDVVSTGVIIALTIIVGVFAARQPKVLNYSLDSRGIHLGPRFYPYNSFKSFSVVEEGAFSHISLAPLKRFMPPLAVHYAPDDEEKIVHTLSGYLPYEEHKGDLVESFTRRVRF